jgi:PEGA domain
MKRINHILSAAIAGMAAGCSTPAVLAPVGPCSASHETSGSNGHLQVYSVTGAQSEGDDPIWYQHSAYRIYNREGKCIKYVGNTVGKWDDTPATVTLPQGNYTVTACAEGYLRVRVPVLIQPGRTTVVHLESGWTPQETPPGIETVRASTSYAVGWRADSCT